MHLNIQSLKVRIKTALRRNSILYRIYGDYLYRKSKRLYEKDPHKAADAIYYKAFKRHIDWEHPKELNEKIQWLLRNTDTKLWTKCADKYRVREYVEEKGYGEILVKLYGQWDNPDDIDFSKLPDKFVLKANNGCGTVKVVTDKKSLNEKKLKKELKRWISRPFGYAGAQSHYLSIKRCIIAEELLEETGQQKKLSPTSLIDYKIWCINGNPQCILVIFGRANKHYYRQVYDLHWNKMPEVMNMKSNGHFTFKEVDIPKPECLNEMLEIACKLSEPFPEVRVDLYVIGGKPYFGELTFTAGMGSFTDEFYRKLGDMIVLPKMGTQI